MPQKPVMFRCDACGAYHHTDVMLLCDDPEASFTKAELDKVFGPRGWIENRRVNPREIWA